MESACFEPGIANPLPPKFAAITGDNEVVSPNPLMRRAAPDQPKDRELSIGHAASTNADALVPRTSLIGVTNPQPCQQPAA
jgi:hypothetical protein